ncbi:MAG: rod shape-determining protein MreC [Candidatus Omnitrophota bacterium]
MFRLKRKNLIYCIVFVLLFLCLTAAAPVFKQPLSDISKLPLNILNSIQREISGIIFYHRNYVQNARLINEMYFLRRKISAMQEIQLENERLKELLGFKQKVSYKVIAAQVIGRSPDNWVSAIIVGKGSSSGIKLGMTVMTHLGLVGRIAEVSKYTSKVMLINDPDFAISSVIQRSRQQGLVTGALGDFLIMKYLPQNADIKIADLVVSAGLTQEYPKGLIIGTVMEMLEDSSGLSYHCLIKPAVNLSNIEEILIILP